MQGRTYPITVQYVPEAQSDYLDAALATVRTCCIPPVVRSLTASSACNTAHGDHCGSCGGSNRCSSLRADNSARPMRILLVCVAAFFTRRTARTDASGDETTLGKARGGYLGLPHRRWPSQEPRCGHACLQHTPSIHAASLRLAVCTRFHSGTQRRNATLRQKPPPPPPPPPPGGTMVFFPMGKVR